MLLAVIEDLLCRDGSDAGQRVELLERRRVQVHRPARSRSGRSTAGRHTGLDDDAPRHDNLRPVGHLRGEVDEAQVGPARRAAGPPNRIGDPRSVRKPVEPRAPNRADDMNDQARGPSRLDLTGRRRRALDRRGAGSDEEPAGDEQRSDEQPGGDERARTRDVEPVHGVHRAAKGVPCLSRSGAEDVTNSAAAPYMTCMRPVTTSLAAAAERHLDDVYRYILYLTRDPQAAEDLTAETFERALRLWHRFDPKRGSERTWLCQVARTTALDHLRAEERRLRREERFASLADRYDEPDEQVVSPWLRSALAALSAAEREVIALRVILDLDAAAAGRVLGISPSACTTRLSRALQKLEEKVGAQLVA